MNNVRTKHRLGFLPSPILRCALLAIALSAALCPGALAQWRDNGVPVTSGALWHKFPLCACPDGSGGVFLVWGDYPNPANIRDIYAQRLDGSGRALWTSGGVAICTKAGDQVPAHVISDGAGGAFIAWFDLGNTSGNSVYIQRVDGSGNVLWAADGVAIGQPAEDIWPGGMVADGAGGVIAAWGAGAKNIRDAYAQRVDAAGNLLWGANGVSIRTGPADAIPEGIAVDGAGGAIIAVWHRAPDRLDYDLYAQRVDASGNVLWIPNGVPICVDPSKIGWSYTMPDGTGGVIISWWDDRNGADNTDIFAQRLDASGNPLWTANGEAICTSPGNQQWPAPVSDGFGGAIITWFDSRVGTNDVYAQRIDASGNALWTPGGVVLCDAPADKWNNGIVSDGAGGAIITWDDYRNMGIGFGRDLFAQRIDGSGTPLWTANGAPVCSRKGTTTNCDPSSDGAGGAIIPWLDSRSNNTYNVYAQRIGSHGSMHTVGVAPPSTLTNCATSTSVAFTIDQMVEPSQIRGYEVVFEIDPAVVTIANPSGDVVEGDYLSSVGLSQFYVLDEGAGVYAVSCVILGGGSGATGDGELFRVLLTPVAEGASAISIQSIQLRDLDNRPLPVVGAGGSIRVDCTLPTMDAIGEAQGGWYNAAPVLSHLGFVDDLNLDLAQYNYDGGTWTEIFSGIDASSWDGDPWTLPGFGGLSQGSHTIYFRVKDDAENWNAGTYGWQFFKDTEPPEPPVNFNARPGHDKTHLSWTNPSGDDTFAGVEIRFNGWLDYPEYATAAPAYPPNAAAGTSVALVAGTSYDDNPRTPRGIYYYAGFSKDIAGNYSELGTSAYDRCTSYWLGDVQPNPGFDGSIDISDLAAFSNAFGVSEGGGGWNAHCDFGPTDDRSRFGIPLPDNKINFEDLMIFSMNYNKVTPAGLREYAPSSRSIEDLASLVGVDLNRNGDGTVSIVLSNRASTLKGVRIVVSVEGGTLERIERGSLFSGASELFFGLVPGARNTADIAVGAIGTDVALARSGEVARLAIRNEGETSPWVRIEAIDMRDLDNAKTEIGSVEEHEAPFVPQATALLQNFPNPFNPVTTITFDLTAAEHVRLDVFDVSGRLLATPVDGMKGAGRHRVEWNGRDAGGSLVPSGICFYRMRTAGFEATRKMILVR
jgi:hypothetical protein